MTRRVLPALPLAVLAAVAAATTGGLRPRLAGAADPPGGTVQDVVYFSKAGPVRVRFHVGLGGKSVEAAWQAAVDQLFAFCDRDGNGALDAKERKIFTAPSRRRPAAVAPDAEGGVTGPQLFAENDPPADKAAFAAKLRASGLGVVDVSIQAARPESARLTDALFRHLDRDGDGKLSPGELTAAAERLAALDLDEDELVTGPELLGTPAPAQNRLAPRVPRQADADDASSARGDVMALPAGSALAVKAVLSGRGGDNSRSLSRAEFGADAKAFAALDKDGNGQLDSDELAAWLRQPPDLEFTVAFDGSPTAGLTPGDDGYVTRTLADARLRLSADGRAATELGGEWTQIAARIRAEFDRLAKDKKTLDRKKLDDAPEAAFLQPLFDFADRNADRSLTRDELDAALGVLGAVTACRVEIAVADQGRGLFELLDKNGDGQLSPRELKAAAGVVKPLARGGDGPIEKGDIPRLFPVSVAPAGLSVMVVQPQTAPRYVRSGMATPQTQSAANVPAWFAKMDRNGDGDVSMREFLGPIEMFRKLDRDGDGLIGPEEARSAK